MTTDLDKLTFPYEPPSPELKAQYAAFFELNSVKVRWCKRLMDIIISAPIVILMFPILISIKVGYIIEGLILPENRGSMLFYYYGISQGKKFKKWKIRLIKTRHIEMSKARQGDWRAYSSEWSPETRTVMGSFVKKYYLDELPQFFTILIGEMSLVGPRPLAVEHYERDCAQGNITRTLLPGGMLGLNHIRKGTEEMGRAKYEYEYLDNYVNYSCLNLILLDLKIMWKGVKLVIKGGGH